MAFRNLLLKMVAKLPVVTNMSLFLATVQVGMEGIVGLTPLLSAALMIVGKEKAGLGLGSIGILVYLVGVNLIQFYIDQFATVAKAILQFVVL